MAIGIDLKEHDIKFEEDNWNLAARVCNGAKQRT